MKKQATIKPDDLILALQQLFGHDHPELFDNIVCLIKTTPNYYKMDEDSDSTNGASSKVRSVSSQLDGEPKQRTLNEHIAQVLGYRAVMRPHYIHNGPAQRPVASMLPLDRAFRNPAAHFTAVSTSNQNPTFPVPANHLSFTHSSLRPQAPQSIRNPSYDGRETHYPRVGSVGFGFSVYPPTFAPLQYSQPHRGAVPTHAPLTALWEVQARQYPNALYNPSAFPQQMLFTSGPMPNRVVPSFRFSAYGAAHLASMNAVPAFQPVPGVVRLSNAPLSRPPSKLESQQCSPNPGSQLELSRNAIKEQVQQNCDAAPPSRIVNSVIHSSKSVFNPLANAAQSTEPVPITAMNSGPPFTTFSPHVACQNSRLNHIELAPLNNAITERDSDTHIADIRFNEPNVINRSSGKKHNQKTANSSIVKRKQGLLDLHGNKKMRKISSTEKKVITPISDDEFSIPRPGGQSSYRVGGRS